MLINIFPDVSYVSATFLGILLDAYGVFWGGNAICDLPGAKDQMRSLVSQGKVVGVLSNTTQMAESERSKLLKSGIEQGVHYHFLITSGEVTRTMLLQGLLPFQTPKKRYKVFGGIDSGNSPHHAIFQGTGYHEVDELSEAEFIFVTVPRLNGEDQVNPAVFIPGIESLIKQKLPMICSNPDLFANEGKPARAVVRQGSIALLYEQMGGKVFYIGKPNAGAYQMAMDAFRDLGVMDPKDVLMVGDTPETDIRGANAFGMQSALVSSVERKLLATDVPTFKIERL